jgi:hypothetical protein
MLLMIQWRKAYRRLPVNYRVGFDSAFPDEAAQGVSVVVVTKARLPTVVGYLLFRVLAIVLCII